jgi:hypothetical protein
MGRQYWAADGPHFRRWTNVIQAHARIGKDHLGAGYERTAHKSLPL